MLFTSGDMKPIYLQLAEWLETEILSWNITAGDKFYSQYQLAEMFNINPATAARSLNILADESILYKKRGLGMFISSEAVEIIRRKRKEQVLKRLIRELINETRLLGIDESDLNAMIGAVQRGDQKEERG